MHYIYLYWLSDISVLADIASVYNLKIRFDTYIYCYMKNAININIIYYM